jgi:hypothetical protein
MVKTPRFLTVGQLAGFLGETSQFSFRPAIKPANGLPLSDYRALGKGRRRIQGP